MPLQSISRIKTASLPHEAHDVFLHSRKTHLHCRPCRSPEFEPAGLTHGRTTLGAAASGISASDRTRHIERDPADRERRVAQHQCPDRNSAERSLTTSRRCGCSKRADRLSKRLPAWETRRFLPPRRQVPRERNCALRSLPGKAHGLPFRQAPGDRSRHHRSRRRRC